VLAGCRKDFPTYPLNVSAVTDSTRPLTAVRRRDEYIARSDYAMQIEPYLEQFGPGQVYLLTLEDLEKDPHGTMRALFQWLGVSPDVPLNLEEKRNVGTKPLYRVRRGMMPIVGLMNDYWRWQAQIEPRLPGWAKRSLDMLLFKKVSRRYIDFRPAEEYLRPILQEKTRTLERLLGRTFPMWRTLWKPVPMADR